MNIVQINSLSDKGGAAKIARRLQQEFKSRGHSSKMLVGRKKFKNIADPDIREMEPSRFLRVLNHRLRLNDVIFPTYNKYRKNDFFKEADIVHYHNIHGSYFSILALPKLTQLKPSLWTLHDPWIIHDEKMTPEYKDIFKGMNPFFRKLRNRAVTAADITLVAPSLWLKEKVSGRFPEKDIELIRHGIDTDIFKRTDKKEARKNLNLPADKKIILFLANGGASNMNKGWKYIENIVYALKDNTDISFVCLGGKKGDRRMFDGAITYVEYIFDEKLLAQYYSAADVLLFPTLAETFGLVIIEAMACGLPTVSFRIGGVPELILHKKTGYIADHKDEKDLYEGLRYILDLRPQESAAMSGLCVKIAGEQYALKDMIDAYVRLYTRLLPK